MVLRASARRDSAIGDPAIGSAVGPAIALAVALAVALGVAAPLRADNIMRLADTTADPGDTDVGVSVCFQNDAIIVGYSLALEYDTDLLECTSVVEVGGYDPDFFNFDIDEADGAVVVGAIIDFSAEEFIPESPDEAVEIVQFIFDVDPLALPGTPRVQLGNGLGSPPIDNEFSNNDGDVEAELVNGVFTIDNPHEFSLTEARPAPDEEFTILMNASLGADLNGYTVELSYDPELLSVLEISAQPTVDLLEEHIPDDADIEFLETDIDDTEGRVTVSIVFDDLLPFDENKVLPGAEQLELLELTLRTAETLEHNDVVTVSFTEDSVGNSVTYADSEITLTPVTHKLFILIDAAVFVRGDANGSGVSDLADGIHMLRYLFSDGTPPPCAAAADFNDDDRVNIADPISLFKWQFLDGPSAREPFPDCGRDPTREDLLCATPPEDCLAP